MTTKPTTATALSETARLLDAAGFEDLARECRDRLAMVDEPAMIYVVGPGNAGKSSLINALAGAPIAEVRVIPWTWRIDVYRRAGAEGARAEIVFADQRRESHSIGGAKQRCSEEEALAKAMTERGERYETDLVEVVWWVDAPDLPQDVALVDTPGLSQERSLGAAPAAEPRSMISPSLVTRERTLSLLHRADVIAWLVRGDAAQTIANQPLFEALAEKGRTDRTVIAILTHWDRIAEARRQEAFATAAQLFAGNATEIVPGILKPGLPGHPENIAMVREKVIGTIEGRAADRKADATRGFLHEQSRLAFRVTGARSAAAAEGLERCRDLEQEALRFLRDAIETLSSKLRSAAQARAGEATQALARISASVNAGTEDHVWMSRFEQEALRPDAAALALQQVFDESETTLVDGLEDYGARVEFPVVLEFDRSGAPFPLVHRLERLSHGASAPKAGRREWGRKLEEAGGLVAWVSEFFTSPQDRARRRMQRAVNAWREAIEADAKRKTERLANELRAGFQDRLKDAVRASYGMDSAGIPPAILRWDRVALELAAATGEPFPREQEGIRALCRHYGAATRELLEGEVSAQIERTLQVFDDAFSEAAVRFRAAVEPDALERAATGLLAQVASDDFPLHETSQREAFLEKLIRRVEIARTDFANEVAEAAARATGGAFPAFIWSPADGWHQSTPTSFAIAGIADQPLQISPFPDELQVRFAEATRRAEDAETRLIYLLASGARARKVIAAAFLSAVISGLATLAPAAETYATYAAAGFGGLFVLAFLCLMIRSNQIVGTRYVVEASSRELAMIREAARDSLQKNCALLRSAATIDFAGVGTTLRETFRLQAIGEYRAKWNDSEEAHDAAIPPSTRQSARGTA